jgi:cellulose synthase/poly-beta-1,6-N-acetylglucosamine synthase-like glycosyltransferase
MWQMYVHLRYFRLLLLPAKPAASVDYPPVSIIIAARNEAENLPALLQILGAQKYPIFEIILVNDRSTDNTKAILQASRQDNLRIITVEQIPDGINPKKNALQMGIQASYYEWILLTDGDCLPANERWIMEMMRARENEKTQIVLGIAPLINKEKEGNILLKQFVQFETLYTAIQYAGFAKGGKPYMGVGRNLLYHKNLFNKIGGFGKFLHTTGGDDDLFINQVANKDNTSIALENALVFSPAPATWRAWYRQKQRHLSVGKHYKTSDQILLASLYASQGGFWLSWLLGCIVLPTSYALLMHTLFLVRASVVYRYYYRLSKKFHCHISLPALPFFDAVFVLYLFVMGGLARFKKEIKWKK